MIIDWAQNDTDKRIVRRISELSNGQSDYWSFRKQAHRSGVHGLIRYPAMMVPCMQAKLLRVFQEEHGNVEKILDPFVGGGTMLTESMSNGLDFTGFDINPLAILVCKVKAGPYPTTRLRTRSDELLSQISHDAHRNFDAIFPGRDKWFTRGATIGLSRIRRAIQNEPDLWMRRFYWVCLAETIRQCSNSRTSTYKLHVKPIEEINTSSDFVIKKFSDILDKNVQRVIKQNEVFTDNGFIEDGKYCGKVNINLKDVARLDSDNITERYDLLFTSPPYGDNSTTIPYGQFSYLALNWINIEDIDSDIPSKLNLNAHSVDAASMGGSLRDAEEKAQTLMKISPSFADFYKKLPKDKGTHTKRLSSFCFDMNKGIGSISSLVSRGGYMVWTLGNRSLAGERVPLDKIIWDMLEAKGISRVGEILRSIPNKRMPAKNNYSDTMQSEIVVIARV